MRPTRSPRSLLLAAALLVSGVAACSSDPDDDGGEAATTTTAEGAAPSPDEAAAEALTARLEGVRPASEVTGPITGGAYGIPYLAMPPEWAEEHDYVEEEWFLEGQATSYGVWDDTGDQLEDELPLDGRWDAFERDPDTPPAYRTRVLVRRPADAADFNGTVVAEWLNVSAGRESDPDFGFLGEQLLEEGYAYVAVSAQRNGVEPGGIGIEIPDVPPEALYPLKQWDPERYGELSHPGDDLSYDIFTQAVRTVAEGGEGTPLGELRPERLVAVGESQSAFRLTTYVNAVQPVTELFDGFLIHSRGGGAAPLNEEQEPLPGTAVRADAGVPVLQFETETDLDFLEFVLARQDDHDHLVTWEVAGAAHADRSTLDYASEAGKQWAGDANVDFSTTCGRINEGPQQPVVNAAFAHLHRWVVEGERPPASPRIETDDADEIVRDDTGIALGGIRTPAVDAPTAVHRGDNPSDSVICVLFGSTEPLTPEQLAERYDDHDDYVAQVRASAEAAVADGYLRKADAEAIIAEAEAADVP